MHDLIYLGGVTFAMSYHKDDRLIRINLAEWEIIVVISEIIGSSINIADVFISQCCKFFQGSLNVAKSAGGFHRILGKLEMTALLLGSSILVAIISRMKEKKFVTEFIKGAENLYRLPFLSALQEVLR